MHPNVGSSIIYNSQDTEATLVAFINRRRDKKDVNTYVRTYILRNISQKKNEILPLATTQINH